MARTRKALVDSRAFLVKAGEGRTIKTYRPNEVVCSQGDQANSLFFIQKGKVKATVLSKGGKDAVLSILGPGEFFGVRCLIGKTRRAATAITLTECSITRIDKQAMLRVLSAEPKITEPFISFLVNRIGRLESDLLDQLFNSSERRLARALLLLANFGTGAKVAVVEPQISQETLAEMIGTTRSRVSFFMNKFRRQGYIDYGDRLLVRSSLLKVMLGD